MDIDNLMFDEQPVMALLLPCNDEGQVTCDFLLGHMRFASSPHRRTVSGRMHSALDGVPTR